MLRQIKEIDGFLIGGASKSSKNFIDIIKITIDKHYESLLITINIILAVILIIAVLLQKSEGGALGLGVSQDNFTSARSMGSFLTKFTSIIATLFIICSVIIVAISRDEIRETQSVLEKQEEENSNLPQIPQSK